MDRDADRAVIIVKQYADLLFYIRKIGAESSLIFSEKPPPCNEHLRDHAKEAGLTGFLQDLDHRADEVFFGADCDVEFDRKHGNWHTRLNHPILEHTTWGWVNLPGSAPTDTVIRAAKARVLRRYMSYMIADVRFARMVNVPLGSGKKMLTKLIGPDQAPETSELNVALNLEFPFLNGIGAKEMVKLREHEGASFERFRNAIRKAILERLRAAASGDDSTGIAAEIIDDVIHPALLEIEMKLRSAIGMLTRGGSTA
jgi:hypothetical protein